MNVHTPSEEWRGESEDRLRAFIESARPCPTEWCLKA